MNAQPLRVLLVEDNPADAELVRDMLSKVAGRSFRVEQVDRFSAALERLAKGGIDVLLLDLKLPDGQGLELVERACARAPTAAIVVLTGTYEEESVAIQALQKGAQDYLFKEHLDSRELARAMRYASGRKQVEEKLRMANSELKQKIANIEWLNQIMGEREAQILELKEQVKSLQAQRSSDASPGQ